MNPFRILVNRTSLLENLTYKIHIPISKFDSRDLFLLYLLVFIPGILKEKLI